MIQSAEAILNVRDLRASIRFYREVLGFDNDWVYEATGQYGGVLWGRVHIMLRQLPEGPFGGRVYLRVQDAAALYAKQTENGLKTAPPQDQPWGHREYITEDPDGNVLVWGSRTPIGAAPSTDLPAEVTFTRRLPTPEELNTLRKLVDWGESRHTADYLEKSWSGWVAHVGDRLIGAVRTTWDAEGWFGVWDVIVDPEWQGKRVGQNLMQRAVDEIHAASEGANVYLFTFRNGFYHKLGFSETEALLRRV